MVSHGCSGEPPTSAVRTWRSWRSAWLDAAYAPDGFWSTQQPGDHFSTAVGAGPLVAHAVAGLVPDGGQAVVDVGAGDGRLLAHLVDLLPGRTLVGVDRRPRPAGLDTSVRWVEDHWDVGDERWVAGGPEAWVRPSEAPLLVAHEWLDDLPVPVVERLAGVWHEVEVDPAGHERPGAPVGPDERAWLARWWDEGRWDEGRRDEGRRAEVGRARDVAWAGLVQAALRRRGRALAVDYGHRAGQRPVDGTFLAYGRGRQRTPVPDGSVNLTAGVAVDALAAAGEAAGATTLLLGRQAEVLDRQVPGPPGTTDAADTTVEPDETGHGLTALVRRSERAALTAPGRWGETWWLLQGLDDPAGRLA